jgi:hypothetical protein
MIGVLAALSHDDGQTSAAAAATPSWAWLFRSALSQGLSAEFVIPAISGLASEEGRPRNSIAANGDWLLVSLTS